MRIGAMLGVFKDTGKVVALIPSGISGYSYFDFETGRRRKINRKNESLFETEAIAFYKPLPLKKIGMGEFVKYIAETLSVSDFIMIALATLAATAVGMFMPYINKLLFNDVLESGEMSLLIAVSVFTVCVSISTLLINAVKAMITARINTKMNINVQAASMMRITSLPADFFKSMSLGRTVQPLDIYKLAVQYDCEYRAYDGSQYDIFAGLYRADICVRAYSGRTGAGDNRRYSGVFANLIAYADGAYPKSAWSWTARKAAWYTRL